MSMEVDDVNKENLVNASGELAIENTTEKSVLSEIVPENFNESKQDESNTDELNDGLLINASENSVNEVSENSKSEVESSVKDFDDTNEDLNVSQENSHPEESEVNITENRTELIHSEAGELNHFEEEENQLEKEDGSKLEEAESGLGEIESKLEVESRLGEVESGLLEKIEESKLEAKESKLEAEENKLEAEESKLEEGSRLEDGESKLDEIGGENKSEEINKFDEKKNKLEKEVENKEEDKIIEPEEPELEFNKLPEEGEEEFVGFTWKLEESQDHDIVKYLSQKEEMELQQLENTENSVIANELRPSPPIRRKRRGDVDESDMSSQCSSPALSISSQLSIASFTKRSRTGSPASRSSRKSTIDVSNPKYLVPFECGWRREVVTRGINSKDDGISKDVYYFHPSGKKLRSLREVSEKLTEGLTIENFTFYKEPIGADPKYETVRNARSHGQSPSDFSNPRTPASKPKSETNETPLKSTPPLRNFVRTPKDSKTPAKREKIVLKFNKGTPKISLKKTPTVNGDRKSPKALPKIEPAKPHPNAPSGPRRKITPRKKPLKPQNNKDDEAINSANEAGDTDMEMGMLPPLWSPNAGSNKSSSNESLSWSHLDEDNYSALLNVFQYLKVQELLRAGRVCRLWRDLASHPSLWRTVRMKNSQVSDWKGFTDSLARHGTKHLDLRKMLISLDESEETWKTFSRHISNVRCLERLDMCRCSVNVIEQIIEACPNLLVFNAQMIGVKDQSAKQKISLESFSKMKRLQELRMKSFFPLHLNGSVKSLTALAENLTTLSLTPVKELGAVEVRHLGELRKLEALELGECSDLPETFPTDVIAKLTKLKRIRLEKGPCKCSTNEMLFEMSKLPDLVQLELINFDIRPGFDDALASCTNIKRLLLIPTYVTQSATTNNIVLSGAFKLWRTLTHFVWVVTMELLKVTELFVDQCEGKGSKKSGGNSVPVLKPVPIPEVKVSDANADAARKEENAIGSKNPTPITVIPIDELYQMLTEALPTTRVKLLKIPFQNTWRQSITDASSTL